MLIGVDVGGTNLRVGVIDGTGVIAERRYAADFSGLCKSLPPAQALDAVVQSLRDSLRQALDEFPAVRAIGLGFPGFVQPGNGCITQSPNLPGLNQADLATPLRAALGLPVIVENDALAAAYGEYKLLAPAPRGLIYLGLGTGVGGGLIVAGQPFPGEHGVAMEVGHLIVAPGGRPCGCGNRGCMEQYASAGGVAISYREAGGDALSARNIADLATQGDAAAIAAYQQAGERLAQALAHILKVVDVETVVIGGGMSAAWPLMQQAFARRMEQDLIPALRGQVRVVLSQAGDQAGMIGAAQLAAGALSAH
ncbi:MAG: ROK family protein [Methylobacterium sp.]|nr:ROK family protein [Methylobacterium sp.]